MRPCGKAYGSGGNVRPHGRNAGGRRDLSNSDYLGDGDCDSSLCNDTAIGSYNKYHLSPNGIPSGNRR